MLLFVNLKNIKRYIQSYEHFKYTIH